MATQEAPQLKQTAESQKIALLEARLSKLENVMGRIKEAEVIVVEQMSKEEAKSKALEFIKEKRATDISELHKAVRCDIGILIEVIDELKEEGKIGE